MLQSFYLFVIFVLLKLTKEFVIMYSKQVIDYAELLLRHKQAQQEQTQLTPTIDVIEDNIENNTEDTQTKVVLSNCSDTLVKHNHSV